ncbi:MAG: hypothetical protein HY963_09195 [Ignavibacteriales bacterium]|nr:hypothetical protein [Ignavibacteriales bacterium]
MIVHNLSAQNEKITQKQFSDAIDYAQTQIAAWPSINVWVSGGYQELSHIESIKMVDGSAKEGTWKVGLRTYCSIGLDGILYTQYCLFENFGSKSKLSVIIPHTTAPFNDELEPMMKEYVKDREDFKDMPILLFPYEGKLALSATIDYSSGGGLDIDDITKRLYNFMDLTIMLTTELHSKKEEAKKDFKKKTIFYIDKASMSAILDFERFEKESKTKEGAWSWVIGERSYWLHNYGDRMVFWLKIKNTKKETQQKVIDELNKYLASNPIEKVTKSEIKISNGIPWLVVEYSLKGLTNKEIIELYESFKEYSEDFNDEAVDIVDDLN